MLRRHFAGSSAKGNRLRLVRILREAVGQPLIDVAAGNWPFSRRAARAVERSLALNPSCRWCGFAHLCAGKSELAIEHSEKSLRLSPRDLPWAQVTVIAAGHFFGGRLEKAATPLLMALQDNPTYPVANRFLASCYAFFGSFAKPRWWFGFDRSRR